MIINIICVFNYSMLIIMLLIVIVYIKHLYTAVLYSYFIEGSDKLLTV